MVQTFRRVVEVTDGLSWLAACVAAPPAFHASNLVTRILAVGIAALAAASPTFAQIASLGPPVSTWQPNGRIETLSIDGTTLYAGGAFDYVGPETGGFGIVDATNDAVVNTTASLTNGTGAIASDGNGGWFVLTSSTSTFGGQPIIVHVLPTGQRDTAWVSPNLSGSVVVLRLHGGRLFVGGFLTAVNGIPRAGVAALDAATGALLPWDARLERAGAIAPYVRAVEFAQGRIYVGGSFHTAGGQPRGDFAVLDEATGAVLPVVLPTSPSPGFVDASVSAGRIFVSGFFGGGQITVRAYDLDLVPVASWDSTTRGSTLLATPTAVYAERWLSPSTSVVALDPTTGTPLPFATVTMAREDSFDTAGVTSMALGHGRLYIGGQFERVNGQVRRSLVAVDAATGTPVAWGPRVSGTVGGIATDGGRVAVGGGFRSIGGIAQQNLVTLDLTTGRPTTPLPPSMPFEVRAVLRLGDVVVAGGYQSTPSGQRLAAYARSSGVMFPWTVPVNWSVSALATDGRELIIGGSFGTIAGSQRTSLASIDLQTAALTSWNPRFDGNVDRIRMAGATAYVVGAFTRVDGEPRFGLAALDTASRTVLPFNPAPGHVSDVAVYRDRVLLSGSFFLPNGSPSAFRWVDRVSGADVGPVTDERGLGRGIAGAGGTIYASVVRIGPPAELVAIDAVSGQSASLGPGPPNPAPIAASDEYLAYFDSAVSAGGFAVYRTPRAGAPRAITASVAGSTITLGWQTGVPPATTSFIVEAGTAPGATDIGAFPVGMATRVSGALPPGTYYTRVRSVGANGLGAASSEAIATVPAPSAPPTTPGTLAGSVASGGVSLTWGASAGNATTYVIEAGTAPGRADIGAFATGHLDTTFGAAVPPGTYHVRVRAANAFGVSDPSNDVTIVVP